MQLINPFAAQLINSASVTTGIEPSLTISGDVATITTTTLDSTVANVAVDHDLSLSPGSLQEMNELLVTASKWMDEARRVDGIIDTDSMTKMVTEITADMINTLHNRHYHG
jgi:hypothetical protein